VHQLANRSANPPTNSINQTSICASDRIDISSLVPWPSPQAPPVRPTVPGRAYGGGLAKRRAAAPGLTLSELGIKDNDPPPPPPSEGERAPPPLVKPKNRSGGLRLPGIGGSQTPFQNFANRVYVLVLSVRLLGQALISNPTPLHSDPSGRLNFGNKAVLHATGVDFSNGSSFAINMGELQLMEELGKGNYGTVQKVYHKRTKVTMAMKVDFSNHCVSTMTTLGLTEDRRRVDRRFGLSSTRQS
jgi:mitogen-activated protein kinase kinase